MRTAIYIGGELYDVMVEVLGREPTRDDVMKDLRWLYGVSSRGYKRSDQGSKNTLTGKNEKSVSPSTDKMDKLRAIMNWAKAETQQTKEHISTKRKDKRRTYEEHKTAWWFIWEWWWVERLDLITCYPYNKIREDIESGNFIF